jgi:hypothetical protein
MKEVMSFKKKSLKMTILGNETILGIFTVLRQQSEQL